jgi:large subunit ribosomal protein L25
MATNTTLKAEKRDGTGKGVARKLRQAGRVPAVLYGRDTESLHMSLDVREAEYLFHSISVDNTIIDVDLDGEKEPIRTLVREIQTHPWKANLLHVDFLRITKGVAVDIEVPVHLVGIPIGVSAGGGVIEQIIHDLPMRCIPSKIPESIEVDISELDLNEVLHISDLTFDEGVEVTIPQDSTVCSIAVPRAEEEVAVDEDAIEGEEGVEGEAPEDGAEAAADDAGDDES